MANGQSSSARPFGETDVEVWGRVPASAGYNYQGPQGGITNWRSDEAAAAQPKTYLTDEDVAWLREDNGFSDPSARQPGVQYADRWGSDPTLKKIVSDAGPGRASDDNGDMQRLLARKPGPGLGQRIYDGVADGLEGIVNIGEAYGKGLVNAVAPDTFPGAKSFTEVDQDVQTGITRWMAKSTEGILQTIAYGQLNSSEMAMASGFNPKIEQVRQDALAAIPSMQLEKPSYIDGSFNSAGRSVENVLDLGMAAWGSYEVVRGGVSLASALRAESPYGFKVTGPLADNVLADADFTSQAVTRQVGYSPAQTPRVNVADKFSVTRGELGEISLKYHDLKVHGLNLEVNANGVLTLEVKAGGDATKLGSGKDMFYSAMQRLSSEKIAVNEIQGFWVSPDLLKAKDTVNAAEYIANRAKGWSEIKSAQNTWTGRVAAEYGFTQVTNVRDTGAFIEAAFRKP